MEQWNSGQAYEQYVGRWSRKIADEFLRLLALPPNLAWADIGCGTGALASTILKTCTPTRITALDSSLNFLSQTQKTLPEKRLFFLNADAACIPLSTAIFDAAVSGLVLNFVRDPDSMIREMARITRPGGTVAVYVWDYDGGMQMMRYFWDAAIAVNPQDARLDQAERFPLCKPEPLQALFERNRCVSVAVHAIEIPTLFQDFNDFWRPFLGRTGPAPSYLASVSDAVREQIRLRLQSSLVPEQDGSIRLFARAWAVQGIASD